MDALYCDRNNDRIIQKRICFITAHNHGADRLGESQQRPKSIGELKRIEVIDLITM